MPVPMANPAPSSFSSSPASSLSSAASAWSSSSLSHYHQNPPAMNQANTPSSSRPAAPLPATPSIASLPSLAHSLSSFPTMTVVTNDMVHYGTLVRTKDASDKLNSALLLTRQRQRQGASAKPNAPTSFSAVHMRYPTPEDDDPVLLFVPKRSKAAKRSS